MTKPFVAEEHAEKLTGELKDVWLPTGTHWGLHIEHKPRPDAGTFSSGGWKHIWHTCEGADFDEMVRVLIAKEAEPHVIIKPSKGVSRVIQFMPFNRTAKALEHPTGTPQTNHAYAVQTEICDFAARAPKWEDWFYRDLAALAVLIEHRCPIPRRSYHTFKGAGQAKRLTPNGFIRAAGHLGHEHVPSQPAGHWDPGAMSWPKLRDGMKAVDAHYA